MPGDTLHACEHRQAAWLAGRPDRPLALREEAEERREGTARRSCRHTSCTACTTGPLRHMEASRYRHMGGTQQPSST